MPNPDPVTDQPGRTSPPWTADATVYFHGGWLSNFAATPGLRLPFGYHGHHEHDRVPVRSVEHWFQACKATSRQQFDLILACGSAAAADAGDHIGDRCSSADRLRLARGRARHACTVRSYS